jgi:Kdo2-lipid IVA 3' secondary acyltransferase
VTDAQRDRRIARIATAGVWLVRLLGWTWRYRVTNDSEFRALRTRRQPIIFALWHGQMLPLLYLHRHQGVSVLISEHGDGEIIARIASSLGYRTVRGSTSRGAARALLGLVRELEDGRDLAITPDGPRGPARSVASGTVVVAQRSGAPIIAAAAVARSGWRLKSWDAFLVPRPFTRISVSYSPSLVIDAVDARDAAASSARVRDALESADALAGG